jgi:hypothetical protein
MKLLSTVNAKTIKGESLGYLTGILYLAPHRIADKTVNLCPYSTAGCRKACLFSAGMGAFSNVKQARINKTKLFLNDKQAFIAQLRLDIIALIRKAAKLGLKPAIRLNGTSDILWELEAPQLFKEFSHVQFYDYTKYPQFERLNVPTNYHLTFSASETTSEEQLRYSQANYAMVFEKQLPKTAFGKEVINGDLHDLRFKDKTNCIVGLVAKGQAKKDSTGFVNRKAIK